MQVLNLSLHGSFIDNMLLVLSTQISDHYLLIQSGLCSNDFPFDLVNGFLAFLLFFQINDVFIKLFDCLGAINFLYFKGCLGVSSEFPFDQGAISIRILECRDFGRFSPVSF